MYEFIYKNSLTGHFLVHPKSYIFLWIHVWIHDYSWIHIWIQIWILCQDTSWYTRIHSFSWIHARYHWFWPLFMWEILSEIMSEEYREEYREEYSEMMEDFYEFILEPHWIHGAVRRRAVSDGARPFCRCCSRATCLTVSLSIWQSYIANTCHLCLITHSVLAASAPSVSPTWISAASLWSKCRLGVSPLQAANYQFKFSPVTSVQVQIRVGDLPIVLSESRYMNSVQHSKSVIVRLSDSDRLQTWSH